MMYFILFIAVTKDVERKKGRARLNWLRISHSIDGATDIVRIKFHTKKLVHEGRYVSSLFFASILLMKVRKITKMKDSLKLNMSP